MISTVLSKTLTREIESFLQNIYKNGKSIYNFQWNEGKET